MQRSHVRFVRTQDEIVSATDDVVPGLLAVLLQVVLAARQIVFGVGLGGIRANFHGFREVGADVTVFKLLILFFEFE